MPESISYPKKPIIRKLGTIGCNNIVETTPIVFKGELYRFEVVRRKSFTSETVCDSWRELDDLPCRAPEEALSSLEAYGINVYQTVKKTALKYINGQNTVTYFGAILF